MAQYGVHSEVGRLRKVLVHRPGLSLERLTPAEPAGVPLRRRGLGRPRAARARRVHRRAARPRRRGALPPGPPCRDARRYPRSALPTRRRARGLVVHRRALARRRAAQWLFALPPERLASVLIGGLLISELDGLDLDPLNRHSLGAVLSDEQTRSSCRRCPTRCSRATPRRGSTAAWCCRRCSGTRGASRSPTSPRSTGTIRASPRRDFDVLVSAGRRRRALRGRGLRPDRVARGRRHHADRQQDGAGRNGRALDRAHGRAHGAFALLGRSGRAGHRVPDAAGSLRTCTSTRCSDSSIATR